MPIETWFPTSIYYEDLLPDEEVRNGMISYVDSFYEKNKHKINTSDHVGNMTGDVNNDFLIHNDPNFYWLNQKIANACKVYLDSLGVNSSNFSLYVQKSWPVICLSGGGSVSQHKHKNSILSAVFYLQSENNGTGKIVFYTPNNILDCIVPKSSTANNLSFESCSYSPVENRLLVFPSNLEHSVENYKSTYNRYSLSYDIMLTANEDFEEDIESLIVNPSLWKKIT